MALLQNVIQRGTHAARPAAGSAGVVYFEVDTGQLFRDSGSAWQLDDTTLLYTAKGQLLASSASAVVGALAAGTDTYVLTADSAQTLGIKWAAAPAAALTASTAALSGNVTLTNADTNYDGPSLSLAAGTYDMSAAILVQCNTAAADFSAVLWDGTTPLSSADHITAGAGFTAMLPFGGKVVLGSTTTMKVSCQSHTAGALMLAAAVRGGWGNVACWIKAIKIA